MTYEEIAKHYTYDAQKKRLVARKWASSRKLARRHKRSWGYAVRLLGKWYSETEAIDLLLNGGGPIEDRSSASSRDTLPDYLDLGLLKREIQYNPLNGHFIDASGQRKDFTYSCGYAYVTYRNRTYRAHRLAWYYVHGTWPKGQIDHVDKDRSNNAIKNLRDVSHSNNKQNTNGLGVSFNYKKGLWTCQHSVEGYTRTVGFYKTKREARLASIKYKALVHPKWVPNDPYELAIATLTRQGNDSD